MPKPAVKNSSIPTFLHILWLRKSYILLIWLILAVPTGIVLSMFDLPRSYSSLTVLRFPVVVGASTNIIRDIAITERESIVNLFKSYHVLSSTANKLNLQVRLATAEVFRKDVFENIKYNGNLREGTYVINFRDNKMARISVKYSTGESENFESEIVKQKALRINGLTLFFQDDFFKRKEHSKITLEVESLNNTLINLAKKLDITSLGRSNFKISLKDRDPWLVSDILNTLRDEFLNIYYGTTEVLDVSVLVQLEKNLELAKSRLEKSQDELSEFYKKNPSLLKEQNNNTGTDVEYFNLKTEQLQVSNSISRINNILAAKPENPDGEEFIFWANEILGFMAQAGEASATILRSKILTNRQKLIELKSTLTPDHPKVTAAQKELTQSFFEINAISKDLLQKLREKDSSLNSRIFLQQPQKPYRPSVKVELELDRLTTANRNHEAAYNDLLAALNRAKLNTGSEFFKVNIVDKARPAIYTPPSLAGRLIISGSAVGCLFFVGPLWYILLQIVFVRVWTKADVVNLLQLKYLGHVEQHRSRARSRKLIEAEKNAPEIEPFLLYYGSHYSLQDLECYRTIREESINYFNLKKQLKQNCLLVTSTRPGEGKSTCVSNLALAFAKTGSRVLIIDAELRLGLIHKIFGKDPESGLMDLLRIDYQSDAEIIPAFKKIIFPTRQKNLFITPRGKYHESAGELMGSPTLKRVLKIASNSFDYVLIDTPPLIIVPDGLSLMQEVTGVIYICRSGVTLLSEAKETISAIVSRNKKIGVILNRAEVSPFQYNQHKKYGYYYKREKQTLRQPFPSDTEQPGNSEIDIKSTDIPE